MSACLPHPLLHTAAHPQDLLGRPLHDLRLSVIDACNFRCPYCMPAEKVGPLHGTDAGSRLSFAQMETLVRGFVALGVRKLRITGGEPLLRKDLPTLIARLAAIEGLDDLALTTNGSLLARHAKALRAAGLSRITVSVDTLDHEGFRVLSGGRGELHDVLDGIQAARDAGFSPIKFNCVVQRGVNDDQLLPLVDYARRHGDVMRFIEYMDVGTCNGWRRERVVPSREIHAAIHARWSLRPLDANYRGEVAKRHAFIDGQGEVGFVSSVSAPFCGDCHRARVSADGRLYTCLFAGDGHDVREALDAGEAALIERVAGLWRRRGDRYSEQRGRDAASRRHVEMFLIGG
ncbi:MAG: GTP 3',8-cyclase MoaA [Pseudoxanthomonas suwonensis]|nr:GTP 3',8-cyclase MoaA [Pseudoxanthomonas suwonensis]